LSETAAEFGGALGIAIFGSVGVAVYRGAMASAVPNGLPPEAADAARDTLGGAIEVAGRLPGELGPALIDAARDAFTQGLHIAAAVSVVGSIGLAILVMTFLRRVRLGAGSEEQPDAEPVEAASSGAVVEEALGPAPVER
ncbi:MAG: MFS transporter, partial [Actinomycetota bacterium]